MSLKKHHETTSKKLTKFSETQADPSMWMIMALLGRQTALLVVP